MESFLQKWGWISHLVLIAIVAILLAVTVNKYVAIQLAPYTVPELPKFAKQVEAKQKTTAKPRARSYAQAIVSRCFFGCEEESADPNVCDPECGEGQLCQQGTCVDPDPNANIPSELPVPSDLEIKLLGDPIPLAPHTPQACLVLPRAPGPSRS